MTAFPDIERYLSRAAPQLDPKLQLYTQELRLALDYYDRRPETLIQVLHRVQELFGYLPDPVLRFVAREMGMPVSRVFGVATFYSFFSRVPLGKHTIQVCAGTACYVRGSGRVLDAFERELSIKAGETTRDGLFSLRVTRCLGACGLAPAVVIGTDVYGFMTPESVPKILNKYGK